MDKNKIALLIDAENISAGYIDKIMEELNKRGTVVYKRVYADWTKAAEKPRARKADTYNLWEVLYRWYMIIQEKGLTPMHQPQNTVGKNSSDIFLIIDAMDIMYAGVADTFCIVSSDGDFTRLAIRLVEGGKNVIMMGEAQTPRSVRHIGEFVLLEEKDNKIKPLPAAKPQVPQTTSSERPKTMLAQLVSTKDDRRDAPAEAAKPAAVENKPQQQPKQQPKPQQQRQQPKPQQAPKAEPAKQEQSDSKPVAKAVAPAVVKTEPKRNAQDYDNQIMSSIIEFIKASATGELTYQRLLSLLRKKHPDCEVIKEGESPIGLFKALPMLSYRQKKATYYFSVKSADEPKTEPVTAEIQEVKPVNAEVAKPAPKAKEQSKAEDKPAEAQPEQVADTAVPAEEKAEDAKPAAKRRCAPRKKAAPKDESVAEQKTDNAGAAE